MKDVGIIVTISTSKYRYRYLLRIATLTLDLCNKEVGTYLYTLVQPLST